MGHRAFVKTGTIEFDPAVDVSILPDHLAGCLGAIEADDVRIEERQVTFSGGMFRFVSNWNPLVPFGSGKFVINPEAHEVEYAVSYQQLVLAMSAAIGLMAMFVWVGEGFRQLLGVSPVLLFMWLFGIGINLAVGARRFERFAARAVSEAPVQIRED